MTHNPLHSPTDNATKSHLSTARVNPLSARQDKYEGMQSHSDALRFRVEARCCKLFGLWVAERLGLDDIVSIPYAKTMVETHLKGPAFTKTLEKARNDLRDSGVEISDHLLDVHLSRFMREAETQVMNEKIS